MLTFVPYADVGVVDPVVSTAYSTRTHVLALFDTLYGSDEATQRRVAAVLQQAAEEFVPYVPLGIARQPTAYRRNLTGMLTGAQVFTNLRKG